MLTQTRLPKQRYHFSQGGHFLQGSSAAYIDSQFLAWSKDPSSVHSSWNSYFSSGEFSEVPSKGGYSPSPVQSSGTSKLDVAIVQLVRNYQVKGHFLARLDPLKNQLGASTSKIRNFGLTLAEVGLSEADLDKEVAIGAPGVEGFLDLQHPVKVSTLVDRLKSTYCDTVGYEFMHILDSDQCNWLRRRIEQLEQPQYSSEDKKTILERLAYVGLFEEAVGRKFKNVKRFGSDGAESMIPGLKACVDFGVNHGVEHIVIGMPHRGRLATLTSVLRKPAEQVFAEFTGEAYEHIADFPDLYTGDVKYHLAGGITRTNVKSGKQVRITLLPNPSHLEAVNPVVLGKVRAKQEFSGDTNMEKVVPILMHGDAAFAGQGIVYECLQMAGLADYNVGGTIHCIVNNQIGFTALPSEQRTSNYASDVAKTTDAPVFHVNADDPEAVCRVFELAMEFRLKFKKDVVIDLVCYRKFGHNEGDNPDFTQPRMYELIRAMDPVYYQYRNKLVKDGIISKEETKSKEKAINDKYDVAFEKSKEFHVKPDLKYEGNWKDMIACDQPEYTRQATRISEETYLKLADHITSVPEGFSIHKNLKRILKRKRNKLMNGDGIGWNTGEALAFGSLMLEGYSVRISGQDVERGTFTSRHAVWHDQRQAQLKGYDSTDQQKDPTLYTALQHLPGLPEKSQFHVGNSPLSEYGVLGFEFGYSLENPNCLTIWEAQFGDFYNGGQIIVDQFISSCESKWLLQSGLVMLLPHGMDGQGPEHSSGRIERFLQMTNDAENHVPVQGEKSTVIQDLNWMICQPTNSANYFHMLRRQMKMKFRKPLVCFTNKSLFNNKEKSGSKKEQFVEQRTFDRVIPDTLSTVSAKKVTKLLFCSGQVYFDIKKRIEDEGIKNVAVARVEQLAPFPYDRVEEQIERFPKAEIVWVQEEPRNSGAWAYVSTRIPNVTEKPVRYAGRVPSASPATGFGSNQHNAEIKAFLDDAFSNDLE